jgi:hypothetical protein
MFRFLLGVIVGLVAAHWYAAQSDSLFSTIEEVWNNASAPPQHMQNQDPERQGLKGKRF